MSIGIFVDKDHPPSPAELTEMLGVRKPLWDDLIAFIAVNYQLSAELSFGGKNYGWNLWYRRGGKSLATLYPHQNSFIVQIVLGRDQVEKAYALALGKHVTQVLHDTPQLHDGRWLFIKVKSKRDVKDIKQLILVKKQPIKLKQLTRTTANRRR